jgi:hypothetical protein
MDPAALTPEDLEMSVEDFATSRCYSPQSWKNIALTLGVVSMKDFEVLEESDIAEVV